MKINRNNLIILIFAFLLLVNLLVIFNLNLFYTRTILAFIFLITIPGLLIMLCFKIREVGFWEYLVYTIGLSVAFIMFAGLHANWTLPVLHITDKPLALYPILIEFDVFLLILLFIAYKRNKDLNFELNFPKFTWLDRTFVIIPLVFPFMAVIGAFLLNNHGTNIVTMIMFGGIAVYVFLLVLFRDKLNENVFPWTILMISLSLLLFGWLRSWYVYGLDISLEYGIFQLAKNNFLWNPSDFEHAYNAMLSVNILPVILSLFAKINDQLIFKILFPIIFSFTPLAVYLIAKRYLKAMPAFYAAFFFSSQPLIMSSSSIPARQLIAIFFFSLTILILFNKEIRNIGKNFLFLIFGFSMIVSHYSTTYIALVLLLLTYVVISLNKILGKRKRSQSKSQKFEKKRYNLTLFLVLSIFIFTFIWYAGVTKTASGLIEFSKNSFSNLNNILDEDVQARGQSPLEQFSIIYNPPNIYSSLKDYSSETTEAYRMQHPDSNFYPEDKLLGYSVNLKNQMSLPLKVSQLSARLLYSFRELLKVFGKIFVALGAFVFLFGRSRKKEDLEFRILVFCSFIILSLIVFLPFSSITYNLARTYQQTLIILSLTAVMGISLVFSFFKENKKMIFMSLFLLMYLFSLMGLIYQITGGEANIRMNNLGFEYDSYYVHSGEIQAGEWVSDNYDKHFLIHAENYARSRLIMGQDPNFKKKIILDVLPQIIEKNYYVYSSYTNKLYETAMTSFKGTVLSFNYPTKFLNTNKNKIYNNGESEVFK